MKKFNRVSVGAALALTLGVAVPASAQLTYNFSDTGNCNFPPATCTVTGSATVANKLTLNGWAAASGANFVGSTITDQTGSGVGMSSSPGDGSGTGDHAIDSSGNHELIALDFGTNKVVLTALQTGWSYNDTDIAVLRWTGATGPDLSTTKLDGTSGLIAKGWAIVSSEDMDGGSTAHAARGLDSHTTGAAVNAANASSWWIVTAHFGGGTLGAKDALHDYFKLLSVTATCVGSTTGGACNSTPGVPEPGSLALAGVALAGAYGIRRRKIAVQK